MQEETRVWLNTVDSVEGLESDINHGRWDAVIQAVSYLSLPDAIQQDMYTQIVLELTELREVQTAQELMRDTAPMIAMKQDDQERYLRLEALTKRSHFDARDAYQAVPKEKRRSAMAQAVIKHVTVAPPSRLLSLVGQAMRWQQHTGLLPQNSKFDVFRGVAASVIEEKEECPTQVGKTIRFGEKSHPECATFSPDGQYFISGSVDGLVEVWDYQTAMLRKDLQYQEDESFMMHDQAVLGIAFSKDSELLATGGQDGQLKVWRVATGQCVRRFDRAQEKGITFVSWSKDSSQVLTASFDHTARAHGIKSGKTLKEYRGHSSYVNSAVYTKDGSKVVTASSDGKVFVFDAKTTESITSFSPPPPVHVSSSMQFPVNAAIVAPRLPAGVGQGDGELIFICTRSNTVALMTLSGQVLRTFCSGKRERGDFVAMAVSPKGSWLYAVAEDHTLYCFSTETGVLEQTVKIGEKDVIGISHHPLRNVLAVYCADGSLTFLKP